MKILLASDGSSNALHAANFVVGLAKTNDLEVHLIEVLADEYAATLDNLNPMLPVWQVASHEDRKQQVSKCHVDELELLSECCVSVSMSHPRGGVCNCILAEAQLRDIDLIVMGARGHSMIQRILLGSVSEYIAYHANCSVLVVRPGDSAESNMPPKKVLVAYDASPTANHAVDEMLKTNWDANVHIKVLSVAPASLPFQTETQLPDEIEEVTRMWKVSDRLAVRIGEHVNHSSNEVVQAGHSGDAIVRAAEADGSDLVLVGENGHGLLGQLIMGNTTKYVLRHAPCSVWISRHHRKVNPQIEVEPSTTVAS